MPPLNILIKPASGLCNMKCKYCFYSDITQKRGIESYGMMTDDVLKTLVKKVFDEGDIHVGFAFQGGEPTLCGLEFFQNLIEYQKQYNVKNIPVFNSIQTNGYIIDEKWAGFFKENNFLVGLSLDGDKDTNDNFRFDSDGKGTFNTIMKTAMLFDKVGVEYNILCVINAQTARYIERIYNFFKKSKFGYLQFIPCLDPYGLERGGMDYSLTPQRYEYFLKKLFDKWYADYIKGEYISIRQFDNWIRVIMGQQPENCAMSGNCTCYGVVEADGGVYPCDFYVFDEWKLGDIFTSTFKELKSCQKARDFVIKSMSVDDNCKECKYRSICRGGCARDRDYGDKNGSLGLNYYCQSYKNFFDYAIERMVKVANSLNANAH